MKTKAPFNDTFQSWAVYAVAVVSAFGIVSWGWDRGPWILVACILALIVVLLALLGFSAWLSDRYNAKQYLSPPS